jgi:NAD(P)H-nitrite reductase large subunit
MENKTIICRCEDITVEEIRSIIKEGFTTLEEIKRITRCGMGPCQGKTCTPIIAREISRITGKSIDEIIPSKARPPVGGIALGELTGDTNEK